MHLHLLLGLLDLLERLSLLMSDQKWSQTARKRMRTLIAKMQLMLLEERPTVESWRSRVIPRSPGLMLMLLARIPVGMTLVSTKWEPTGPMGLGML